MYTHTRQSSNSPSRARSHEPRSLLTRTQTNKTRLTRRFPQPRPDPDVPSILAPRARLAHSQRKISHAFHHRAVAVPFSRFARRVDASSAHTPVLERPRATRSKSWPSSRVCIDASIGNESVRTLDSDGVYFLLPRSSRRRRAVLSRRVESRVVVWRAPTRNGK